MIGRWSHVISQDDLEALALAAAVEMSGSNDDEVLLGVFRDVPAPALAAFGEVVLAMLWQRQMYGQRVLSDRGLRLARARSGLPA